MPTAGLTTPTAIVRHELNLNQQNSHCELRTLTAQRPPALPDRGSIPPTLIRSTNSPSSPSARTPVGGARATPGTTCAGLLDGVGIGDLRAALRGRQWRTSSIPTRKRRPTAAASSGGDAALVAGRRPRRLEGVLRREYSLSRRWLTRAAARVIAEGHEHWVPSILMEPRTHQLVTCSYDDG